jgi:hypothetical protein
MRIHPVLKALFLGVVIGILAVSQVRADDVYGRIRGTVTDPSGAVIPGVPVTAVNTGTGLTRSIKTGSDGGYELLNLPAPAVYTVSVEQVGFKRFLADDISLALNQVYVLNITLELGKTSQQVTVEAAGGQVETTSIERGARLTSSQVVSLPLNGRDWIQLQQTLPGVVGNLPGDVGPDNFSTSGARSQDNGFLINGIDNNDLPLNNPNAIPSPDAIGEVNMITNTINPEYGRSSGAVLNAVTKSGTNQFHGDGFEFYRDPFLNARNFFLPTPAQFHQNQFGATIGGPIWKNHTFFFFSYQGTRNREPITAGRGYGGGTTPVLTADQLSGQFADLASSKGSSPFSLVGDSGATFPAGTLYSTIFSQGVLPPGDMSSISTGLVSKYMPPPNFNGNEYSYSPITTNTFNQYITRIDHNFSSKDSLSAYWFFEQDTTLESESFYGSALPGFGDEATPRPDVMSLTWNHTISSSIINEAKVGYNRLGYASVYPQSIVQPSSLGFTGIIPQNPKVAQVPCVQVIPLFNGNGGCTFGFSEDGPQPRIDQTYQASDNFTWIKGRHTLKFGFDMRRSQVWNPFYFLHNGFYEFEGSGSYTTGDPSADFLLGIPDYYVQSSGGIIDARARQYYSYAQDQFKVLPNLTVTFGTGWQINMPTADIYNENLAINAYVPGQQSSVYPTSPPGLVFPGDTGINTAGYFPKYNHFGPRLGFAWSPGSSTKWSLRGGLGVYYNQVEEELTLQNLLAPPLALEDFGIGDVGGSPSFAAPFTDIKTGASIPNKYPFFAPAKGSQVNFGFFEPFSLSVISPSFTTPSAYNYNLTLEHEITGSTIVSVAYVGHQGRHLEAAYEANPPGMPNGTNPTCVATPGCNTDNIGFTAPQTFRNPLTNNGEIVFGSVGYQSTNANSNYNSFQATATRHTSRGLELQASYTWSHSLDNTSSYENVGSGSAMNPFNLESNYGDSAYDARQRVVVSYSYEIPSVRQYQSFQAIPSRLTDGWRVGGITTFQTGFPIDTTDSADNSDTCYAEESHYGCSDRPNVLGRQQLANPRTGTFTNGNPAGTRMPGSNYYFNPNTFGPEANGVLGDAGRNYFHGPGLNNWTVGVYKDTRITESTKIELRFEFFNIFNHAQFENPVEDINNPLFGQVVAAYDPRIIQLAAKFVF